VGLRNVFVVDSRIVLLFFLLRFTCLQWFMAICSHLSYSWLFGNFLQTIFMPGKRTSCLFKFVILIVFKEDLLLKVSKNRSNANRYITFDKIYHKTQN
jgi:hypothetical protein